ncbi:MAG: hypothetical protein JW743_02565 [Deltaproteobacteria bacterium]|nr:hypothetical protein [Deltaproteobacteria bacterium]MBN2844548.1 hypothetical protein [Deltaproteobacteria bacterium]
MKKIIAIVFILLFSATVVLADEVEDTLAGLANEPVMTATRQMIQKGIEKDDAIEMTKLMLQNQFSLQQTLQAQQMLMQAVQSGLPAEPLMNKAKEGMAKKIQSGSVLQAMEQVQSRYAFTYRKAEQLTEDPEEVSELGDLMADALTAGFQKGDIEPIMERLMTRTMERQKVDDELATETCMTLRDMARLGVSSDAITDVVSEALSQNYTASEMEALRESFMYAAKKGEPEKTANSYATQMRQGESPESPGSSGAGGTGPSGETGGTGSDGAGSNGSGSGGGGANGDGPGGPGGAHK